MSSHHFLDGYLRRRGVIVRIRLNLFRRLVFLLTFLVITVVVNQVILYVLQDLHHLVDVQLLPCCLPKPIWILNACYRGLFKTLEPRRNHDQSKKTVFEPLVVIVPV